MSGEKKGDASWVSFSPDGSRLIASGVKDTICMDTTTGKEIWRFENRTTQTLFAPDGKVVAAISLLKKKDEGQWEDETDCEVQFLSAVDGKPDGREPLPYPSVNHGMHYSPDGSALAWRTSQKIVVWDLKASKVRRTLPAGEDGYLYERYAFGPDGKTLTALVGRTLHRWDLATGKDLYPDVSGRGHDASAVAVAWSPDGKRIATMSEGYEASASLCVWDAATGNLQRTLPAPRSWWHQCHWLAFTPDGARLLAAGVDLNDGVVHCWDPSTGKKVWSATSSSVNINERVNINEWGRHLDGCHLTADGKRLITLNLDITKGPHDGSGEEIEWNAATGERVVRRELSKASQSDVFSPDGRLRVLDTGEMIDQQTGKVRRTLKAPFPVDTSYGAKVGAFSPDGALFAARLHQDDEGGKLVVRGIQVWETATGKPLSLIPNKESCLIAFSPDGRTLVAVGREDIRAWDTVTAEEVYRRPVGGRLLSWHSTSIAFSPDGHRLATCCDDTTAVVWDLSSAVRRPAPAAPLTTKEDDALWLNLADDDAAKAYAAIDRLASRPDEAARLLRERLRPADGLSDDQFKHLLAGLDDDDFNAREAASHQLLTRVEQVKPALRDALKRDLTAEQRRRVMELLRSAAAGPSAETLRGLRGVRALVWAGTPAAKEVLEKLADGGPNAALTREARSALARWK
jgi:WD40 repeat protein